MNIEFHTDGRNAEFYVAILSLGLLQAMKKGEVSFETGIWSLGRPDFWIQLEEKNAKSGELLDVVNTMDEIDAISNLGSEECTYKVIDELENKLLSILQRISEERKDFILKTLVVP